MAKKATIQSPLFKKFSDLKAKHPDAIILFRQGDFYESYNEDADACAEILGITKTHHNTYMDIKGMTRIPFVALDIYLQKLIKAGKRVSIFDDINTPAKTFANPETKQEEDIVLDAEPKEEAPERVETTKEDILKEQIKILEIKLEDMQLELEETASERDEAEAEVKRVAKRIITETVKHFQGNVPTTLNDIYSREMGKFEYIKLKHTCSGKITNNEMAFLLEQAEKGLRVK